MGGNGWSDLRRLFSVYPIRMVSLVVLFTMPKAEIHAIAGHTQKRIQLLRMESLLNTGTQRVVLVVGWATNQKPRSTWFTQDDVNQLVADGINTARIPVSTSLKFMSWNVNRDMHAAGFLDSRATCQSGD